MKFRRRGNDSLLGDDGNDYLLGDFGEDTITGGAGQDVFVLSASAGPEYITDYFDNQDFIGLGDDLTFADLEFEEGLNLVSENALRTFTIINAPGGKLLAILASVPSPALLTEEDFITVGETGLGSGAFVTASGDIITTPTTP